MTCKRRECLNEYLTGSFIIINVDPFQLQFALSRVNSTGVNAVFFRDNFPKLEKKCSTINQLERRTVSFFVMVQCNRETVIIKTIMWVK